MPQSESTQTAQLGSVLGGQIGAYMGGPEGAKLRPSTKPASLPTSVHQVDDQPLLCIQVGPLLTYMTPAEGIALRAQLDLELARWSGGFL